MGLGLFWIFTHLGFGFDSIYLFLPKIHGLVVGCWLLVMIFVCLLCSYTFPTHPRSDGFFISSASMPLAASLSSLQVVSSTHPRSFLRLRWDTLLLLTYCCDQTSTLNQTFNVLKLLTCTFLVFPTCASKQSIHRHGYGHGHGQLERDRTVRHPPRQPLHTSAILPPRISPGILLR